MGQYMIINGIKGNVTAKGYEGAIGVHGAAHLGVRPVHQQIGTANQEMGMLHLDHMKIVKAVDGSSALLWQYFFSGKHIPKLEVVRCSVSSGKPEWQTKITLHNVLITSLHENSNGHDASESISFAFSKMERGYRSKNASGQWQTPCHTSFDLATVKAG